MKTKLLALGFSMAFLLGNAVYGGYGKDRKSQIYTLEPFVVTPHMVKLLNDQKLQPVDYEAIIQKSVEDTLEQIRQVNTKNLVALTFKVIEDDQVVATTHY